MRTDLGLSNAAFGLGAGLFFIGYFWCEVPSNIILQKVGARAWFTRILVTWGLATVAMAWVKDETWFYVLRFIVGAAEAGFAPGTQYFFSQWFPNECRARYNGWFLLSIPLAIMINGPLSGFIMSQLGGVSGFSGWQWLFIFEGIATIVLAPIMFATLTNSPKEAKWLTPDEVKTVEDGIGQVAQHASASDTGTVLRTPMLWLQSAAYFLVLLGNYGLAFWMPQLIKNSGVQDTMTIGWLAAIPSLAALVLMLVLSRLSDGLTQRKLLLFVCAAVAAAGLVLTTAYSKSTPIALVGMAMTSACVFSSIPIFWAYIARWYVGPAAAVGFAVINSIGNLAGFLAPYMVGLVIDTTGKPDIGIYVLAALVSVGAVMFLFLKEVTGASAAKSARLVTT